MRPLLVLSASLAMLGCATAAPKSASGQVLLKALDGVPSRHAPDDENTGLLVLYRAGGAVLAPALPVRVDTAELGELARNGYVLIEAQPGEHELEVGAYKGLWTVTKGGTTYASVSGAELGQVTPTVADAEMTVDVKLKWRKVVNTVIPQLRAAQ